MVSATEAALPPGLPVEEEEEEEDNDDDDLHHHYNHHHHHHQGSRIPRFPFLAVLGGSASYIPPTWPAAAGRRRRRGTQKHFR